MRTRLTRLLLVLISATAVFAQQGSPSKPKETPEDISGMYTFLHEGEFVQINLEGENVTGFVSRFGDNDTDKGTFLDQFFSKGSLAGDALVFTTRPIHGVWFEFSGTVGRGPGKTKKDEAYRIIKGKLIRHTGVGENDKVESREIAMKSFPGDDEDQDAASK